MDLYSACGPFTKNKIKTQKFKETEELAEKACFQHNVVYGDFKYFTKKTSGKVLHYKTFEIASNPMYDGYQRGMASRV